MGRLEVQQSLELFYLLLFASLRFLFHLKVSSVYITKYLNAIRIKKAGFVNNFNSKKGLEKQFISLETYLPTSETVFEGHKFKAPNQS